MPPGVRKTISAFLPEKDSDIRKPQWRVRRNGRLFIVRDDAMKSDVIWRGNACCKWIARLEAAKHEYHLDNDK